MLTATAAQFEFEKMCNRRFYALTKVGDEYTDARTQAAFVAFFVALELAGNAAANSALDMATKDLSLSQVTPKPVITPA